MSYAARLTDKKAQDFAASIGDFFKSLPHLPKGLVQFFVQIAPYLALIGAVLSLFAGPVLGLLGVLSLITFNPFLVLTVFLAAILSLATAWILFMAYKPLQGRKYNGWMLLFWCQILGAAQTIYHIVLQQQGVFGLVGIVIGLYILYEMRPFYKK